MKAHPNARTTPKSRFVIVQRVRNGSAADEVATQFGVSLRTVYKWLNRFKKEGSGGLNDRSSRPLRIPFSTPPARTRQIEALRRLLLEQQIEGIEEKDIAQMTPQERRLLVQSYIDFEVAKLLTFARGAFLEVSPEGANGSMAALQLRGTVAPGFANPFAGMWTAVAAGGVPTNLSAYAAIRFYARGSGGPYLAGVRRGTGGQSHSSPISCSSTFRCQKRVASRYSSRSPIGQP